VNLPPSWSLMLLESPRCGCTTSQEKSSALYVLSFQDLAKHEMKKWQHYGKKTLSCVRN